MTKLGLNPKYSDSSSSLKWDLLCLKTISGKIFYLEWHTRSLSFWCTLAFLFHLLSFTHSSLCFINMELLTTLHKSNAPCSLMPLCELLLQLGCFCSFLYLTNYYMFFKTQCTCHLCEPCLTFSPLCSHTLHTFLQLHEIGKQINSVKRSGFWRQADTDRVQSSLCHSSFSRIAFIEYELHKAHWAMFQESKDDNAVLTLKKSQS